MVVNSFVLSEVTSDMEILVDGVDVASWQVLISSHIQFFSKVWEAELRLPNYIVCYMRTSMLIRRRVGVLYCN